MAERFGWYSLVYLGGIIVAAIIAWLVNLSPNGTPYAKFIGDKTAFPVLLVLIEFAVSNATGHSLFPFGSYDPKKYLLQGLIGYENSVLAAVASGIVIAAFFGYTVVAWNITWLPVAPVTTGGLNALSSGAAAIFSGAGATSSAFLNGYLPTFFENPSIIYALVLVTWTLPALALMAFGADPISANAVGFTLWLLSTGVIFSYVMHAYAYQAVEPSYTRAFIFVLVSGIPTGLTGIPFPMDLAHFTNNFSATYFSIVSWGMVSIMIVMPCFIRNKKFRMPAGISALMSRAKKAIAPMAIGTLVLSGAAAPVMAMSWDDVSGSWNGITGWFSQNVVAPVKEVLGADSSMSIVNGCSLITPTWGYYDCKKSANPVSPVSDSVSVSGLWQTNTKTFSCTASDVDPLGFQTPYGTSAACRVKLTQISGPANPTFACSQTKCKGGTYASGNSALNDIYYLKFGETITFKVNGAIVGTDTIVWQSDWYQKTLNKNTWTGYKSSEYPGCDENTVRMISNANGDLLPRDQVRSLDIGNRVNFIDTYIPVPVTGNYFNHPAYGEVVCSNGQLFQLNMQSPSTGQGSTGTFMDQNGACYYTLGTNSVGRCDCSPGMTLGSQTCSNEGLWVSLDKGTCVRGGIANVQLCPGAGQNVVDLSRGTVTSYTCEAITGSCIANVIKTGVRCDPSMQQGCAGNEFCNYNYECQAKPTTRVACPYDWCSGDPNYLDKSCLPGLQPCPTISYTAGACKVDCAGIVAPVEPEQNTTEQRCYDRADLDCKITLMGVSTDQVNPICSVPKKLGCWFEENKVALVVSAIAAALMFVSMIKLVPGLIQAAIIAAAAIFVVTMFSMIIGGAITVVALLMAVFIA